MGSAFFVLLVCLIFTTAHVFLLWCSFETSTHSRLPYSPLDQSPTVTRDPMTCNQMSVQSLHLLLPFCGCISSFCVLFSLISKPWNFFLSFFVWFQLIYQSIEWYGGISGLKVLSARLLDFYFSLSQGGVVLFGIYDSMAVLWTFSGRHTLSWDTSHETYTLVVHFQRKSLSSTFR